METSVERVDDVTVTLHITVEQARVKRALNDAATHLAGEVRVPGFRPGKAPRRVLESRLGAGAIAEHAVRDALPTFYTEAVQSQELQVLGSPRFDVETFEEGQDAVFTATVEVRPEFELPELSALQVPHPEWELTDDELATQLDTLRERFAELETVQRPVQAGDRALITVTGTQNGQDVEAVRSEDVLYEVGDAKETERELDAQLLGAEPGAIRAFTDTLDADYGELAGQKVDFTVILKEVKASSLPELDDDFALTASEFDTIEELRDDLARQLGAEKRRVAQHALRGRVVEAVTEQVELTLPNSMVEQTVQMRAGSLVQQLEQQGLELAAYLQAVGQDQEAFVAQLREEARKTVKAQLVVDAVGREAGLNLRQEDLSEEVLRHAMRVGRPPEEVAELMTHPDNIGALISDVFRRKAIDHLLETVQVLSAPPPEPEPEVAETEAAEAAEEPGPFSGASQTEGA